MGLLSHDATSLILLFAAPVLVPKAIAWLLRFVQSLRTTKIDGHVHLHGPAAASGASKAKKASRLRWLLTALPSLIVLAISVLSVTVRRPLNIFDLAGQRISLTAPFAQLEALAHTVSAPARRYNGIQDVLPFLTSLDGRLLYAHFGHETFQRCLHLCRSDQPLDYLAFHLLALCFTYSIAALSYGIANRRFRSWFAILLSAAFVAEAWTLATRNMARAVDAPNDKFTFEELNLYRNVAFALLSILSLILPHTQRPATVSQQELTLVAGLQALLQKQDMLQMRIRILRSLRADIDVPQEAEVAHANAPPRQQLNEQQKQSLMAWVESLLSDEVPAPKGMTTFSPPPGNQSKSRNDGAVNLDHSSVSRKLDGAAVTSQQVQSSAAEVAELEPKSTPPSGVSSPASSDVETPTPANNPPPRFDIFASQLQKIAERAAGEGPVAASSTDPKSPVSDESELQTSTSKEAAAGEESEGPEALARAGSSTMDNGDMYTDGASAAGPIPPVSSRSAESLRNALDVDISSMQRQEDAQPLMQTSDRSDGALLIEQSDRQPRASAPPRIPFDGQIARKPRPVSLFVAKPSKDTAPLRTITNLQNGSRPRSHSLSTPDAIRSASAAEDGWTTVVSRKKRSQEAAP